jgi:ferric-dicitrate binding protein FerR (iron transport regulator)
MYFSDWHRKHLLSILKKYEAGQATPAEIRLVESYLDRLDELNSDADVSLNERNDLQERMKARLLQRVRAEQGQRMRTVRPRRILLWGAVAAAVLLLIGIGMYLRHQPTAPVLLAAHDKAPGHNGAVLQLSDGSSIVLDSITNGTVAMQGKVKVVKENGAIRYEGTSDQPVYNTITTDNSRQWKMLLPDGTEVWLNAASSIRYPLSFAGKERVVDITGEVYFKVVHNAAQPFKVRVGGHVIEDLGTAFNVNAYEDEPVMKTTLLEGLAKVNGTMLRPGQLAQVNKGQTQVILSQPENAGDAIVWTNGQLSLESGDVATLLRKIARWYDVKIKVNGTLPGTGFVGVIDKDVYLSSVIKALAVYGIDARLEHQTLIVSAR